MSERVEIKVKLGQLLDPTTHKIAISLPDLVQQTNQFSVKNRPGCTATLKDSNPQDLYLQYNVKCSLKTSDPAGHDVRVHFDISKIEETQNAKDLDVRCSCSCPAFLYWGAQWNLHQRDGLEGQARPQLRAPSERLDLRGHFVICKHCKAVFERILPAVQHNIVNILRKREVERNKKKEQEEPEKLQRNQKHMKRRKLLEKIRKVKNKDLQKKMLDVLKREEEKHLQHIVELNEEENHVKQEGPEHKHEVERTEPATQQPSEPETRETPETKLPSIYDKPSKEEQEALKALVEDEMSKEETEE